MLLSQKSEGVTMNRMKVVLTSALVLFGAALSAPALAWHGGGGWHGGGHVHVGVGVVVGGPVWWGGPWYYPPYYGYGYPPYYYPPTVVSAPAQYVEQGGAEAGGPAQQGYWYYCTDSKTYYPYVKECPGGWQRVAPRPSGG
jgi:hypothetical protein